MSNPNLSKPDPAAYRYAVHCCGYKWDLTDKPDRTVGLFRDQVYSENSEAKGIAEIIIGKGRDIETGTVRTAFLGQYSRFEQLSGGWVAPQKAEKVTSLANRYGNREKF